MQKCRRYSSTSVCTPGGSYRRFLVAAYHSVPGDERARNRPDPLSLGSALRGAALALLLCRERHDSPAEAPDSSGITSSGGHDLRRLSGNWRKRLKAVLGGEPSADGFFAVS